MSRRDGYITEDLGENAFGFLICLPWSLIPIFAIFALLCGAGVMIAKMYEGISNYLELIHLSNMWFLTWIREFVTGMPVILFVITTIVYIIAGYFLWDYVTEIWGGLLLASFIYMFYPNKIVFILIIIATALFASVARDYFKIIPTFYLSLMGAVSVNHLYKFVMGFIISAYTFYQFYGINLSETKPTRLLAVWAILYGFIITFIQGLAFKSKNLTRKERKESKEPPFKHVIGYPPVVIASYKPMVTLFNITRIVVFVVTALLLLDYSRTGVAVDVKAGTVTSFTIVCCFLVYMIGKTVIDAKKTSLFEYPKENESYL